MRWRRVGTRLNSEKSVEVTILMWFYSASAEFRLSTKTVEDPEELTMESSPPARSQLRVLIVMPVHDDWTSAAELVQRIDRSVSSLEFHIESILIDDGSALTWERSMFLASFSVVRKIQILRLIRNVGHQRAIAIGLMHAKKTNNCDAIVVMDADGEDTAEGVVQLLHAY